MAEEPGSAAGTATVMAKTNQTSSGGKKNPISSRHSSSTTQTDFESFYQQLEKKKYEWFERVADRLEADEAKRMGSTLRPRVSGV
jgi:hypothetical protein